MSNRNRRSSAPVVDSSCPENHQALLAVQTTLLKPLGADFVDKALRDGLFRVATIKKGSTIHFEGDACRYLEVVLSGQISIERIDAEGNLMTVAQCRRNEVLGGNLLFSQRPVYPMTLTAVQDSSLLLIEKELLFDLLSKNPGFLKAYLELTSDRANTLGDQIRHYVNKSIRMCLVNFLKQEYSRQKSNPIRLSLSKKMLAEKIGVQRTSISRELAKMRRDGLIDYDRGAITILDENILED